ncbi:MAG: type IV pilus assembly protein PilM [Phycisphaerales bacterium]|nr:type IV pilus assembly protein PilM [Phycisphaerales bacterium]
MAQGKAAWGIEVGAYEIKAIRLQDGGATGVEVTDFAVVRHKKVLTEPDVDQNEVIRLSLGQLISQKNLQGENLVMSVPGHSAFARFAKLPPVEPKKVPDIVKFEAVQQIPFPIDEVEWDYETFMSEDTPEIEVGIFAITRQRVQERLDMYSDVGMSPEVLTLSPVSFFNAVSYDHDLGEDSDPVVYIDIGTMATDVIIADQGRCWIRTFPIGGTHFTEAIMEKFKLSYSKAEKLKMETSTSKYAKNIMGAMRPVFTDLLQELQRSLDYFRSSHPNRELSDMIGAGSTFKIPGLRKFIGQQLQVEVKRLDEFHRISVPGREAATFAEHNVSMATAYGLAMQGIGLAPIDINLVPTTVLREQLWHQKTRWFIGAAALAIAAGGVTFIRPILDQQALDANPEPAVVRQVTGVSKKNKTDLDRAIKDMSLGTDANHMAALLDYKSVWPHVVSDAAMAALAAEPRAGEFSADEEVVLEIDPSERRLISISSLTGQYVPSSNGKGPGSIDVRMEIRLTHDEPRRFANETVMKWLRDNESPSGLREGVPYLIKNPDLDGTNIRREKVEDIDSSSSSSENAGSSSSSGGSSRRTPGGGGGGSSRRTPGGGGGSSRRTPGGGGGGGGSSRRSPGGGGGGGSAPAGSGSAGLGSSADQGDSSSAASAAQQGDSFKEVDLNGSMDEIAPLPDQPKIYPPGTTVSILDITFTLQIVTETAETNSKSASLNVEMDGGAS